MTIGIGLPVCHDREGYGARGPRPELADGGGLLFDKNLLGRRGWLLLFHLTEFLLPLLLPFCNGLRPEVNRFLCFLSRPVTLHPVNVRLLEQCHRIDIEIHVRANRDEDIDAEISPKFS